MDGVKEALTMAVSDVISSMSKAEQQLHLLSEFEKNVEKGLTQEQFLRYGETELRYFDVLGEALMIAMPFLSFEKRTVKELFFKSKGITVCVPFEKEFSVKINIDDWYFKDETELEKAIREKTSLQRDILKHDIKALRAYLSKQWAGKAKLLFPNKTLVGASVCFLLVTAFNMGQVKDKLTKEHLLLLEEELIKLTKQENKEIATAKIELKNQNEAIEALQEELSKWAATIQIRYYDATITKGED